MTTGAGTSVFWEMALTVSSDIALVAAMQASTSLSTAPTAWGLESVISWGMTSPAMGNFASPPVTSAHTCWRSAVRSRVLPCCLALASPALAACSGRTAKSALPASRLDRASWPSV